MADNQSAIPGHTANQPFRLLDLPDELQLHIYRKYYEDKQITLPDPKGDDTECHGPSLNVERTCHKVRNDAQKMRKKYLPRTLTISHGGFLAVNCLGRFIFARSFESVRKHINTIVITKVDRIETGWDSMPWEQLVDSCPNLRKVCFELVMKRFASRSTWRASIATDDRRLAISLGEGLSPSNVRRWEMFAFTVIRDCQLTELSQVLKKYGREWQNDSVKLLLQGRWVFNDYVDKDPGPPTLNLLTKFTICDKSYRLESRELVKPGVRIFCDYSAGKADVKVQYLNEGEGLEKIGIGADHWLNELD